MLPSDKLTLGREVASTVVQDPGPEIGAWQRIPYCMKRTTGWIYVWLELTLSATVIGWISA